MKVKDLKKNERNPRKIDLESKRKLQKSVQKYGDLGGIIFNTQSKRLVGGHQRSSVLSPDSKIVIEKKYDEPTEAGTTAEGYVIQNGERFSYREVSWDKTIESEAMIAANKHGGTWDKDVLQVTLADIGDLESTGFTEVELGDMNISFEVPEIKVETDAQTVANTPKSEEQIPTANPNENAKKELDFSDVEEKKKEESTKRYVLIIDCGSEDEKMSLRAKIQPLVEEAGHKII